MSSKSSIARRYRELRKDFPNLRVYDAKKDFGFNLEHLSRGAANISSHLEMADYETYFVGGVMRDIILGRDYNDIDICTSATPSQIKQLFKGRCQIIGRRFQITHVAAGDKRYDVATFREDRKVSRDKLSAEQRKAADNGILMVDNAFSTKVGEDVKRRDFTINALLGKVLTNEVIDLYNGIDHLLNRRVVMIGDPDIRLREDPMRIIRAIRLSAKLNFTIDEDLRKNMFTHKNLLRFTSESRLSDEVSKTLASGAAFKVIELFSEYNLTDLTMPQFHDVVSEEIAGYTKFGAIKGFKPEFGQLIAEQNAKLKEIFKERDLEINPIKAYSPTLALTLAGALITDQRVAYDQPVNPAFLLATMRTVGFIEVFLRYYESLAQENLSEEDFAKEIEGVLLSLSENSFSESCNKFNGRDKENTKTILCNLAMQFITQATPESAKRMSEPMFRAAFSIFRLFMQLFQVDSKILANFRSWNEVNEQYQNDVQRRRPVRRNPQGEIISSKRRREVPDFPYMDIADKEMHIRLAPSIVNIQQAMVLHQNYQHKRSAGLELLDIFIQARREYYNQDQDELERELGQEDSIYYNKQVEADLALSAKKRFQISQTLEEDIDDPDLDFFPEDDPDQEKARIREAAQKILNQTHSEDMSENVNAIPFTSDLDLYYDLAEFQTAYNADFGQDYQEDLQETQEQTLGRLSAFNFEQLEQVFHEFDDDFYLNELRPRKLENGLWDRSAHDAALERLYNTAPELPRNIVKQYAAEKVARATIRIKAQEQGLNPNLSYDETLELLRSIEDVRLKESLRRSEAENKQRLVALYENKISELKQTLASFATNSAEYQAISQQIAGLEKELAQVNPTEVDLSKSANTYSLDTTGNILQHKVVTQNQVNQIEKRVRQFRQELDRRYNIVKNRQIVAELHAKGIYHLDKYYDTYHDGSSLDDFFVANNFTEEEIEIVTNGDRTYEEMYEHLEELEQEYLAHSSDTTSGSMSAALSKAYEQAENAQHQGNKDLGELANLNRGAKVAKTKEQDELDLFADLEQIFAAPSEQASENNQDNQDNQDEQDKQAPQGSNEKQNQEQNQQNQEENPEQTQAQSAKPTQGSLEDKAMANNPKHENTSDNFAWGQVTEMPSWGFNFNEEVEEKVEEKAEQKA
ncbi:hypothetical protein CKF54_05640, partial [Psittacicella hinzii]